MNIISNSLKAEIDRVNRGVGGRHARPRDFRPLARERKRTRLPGNNKKRAKIALACQALSSDREFGADLCERERERKKRERKTRRNGNARDVQR